MLYAPISMMQVFSSSNFECFAPNRSHRFTNAPHRRIILSLLPEDFQHPIKAALSKAKRSKTVQSLILQEPSTLQAIPMLTSLRPQRHCEKRYMDILQPRRLRVRGTRAPKTQSLSAVLRLARQCIERLREYTRVLQVGSRAYAQKG